MKNFKDYSSMTMDELEAEITTSKQQLRALEKLLDTRRAFGEKTTKQIEAEKKAAEKAAAKKSDEAKSAPKDKPQDKAVDDRFAPATPSASKAN